MPKKKIGPDHQLAAHIPFHRSKKFWSITLVILAVLVISSVVAFGIEPIIILGLLGSTLPSMFLADLVSFIPAAFLGLIVTWLAIYTFVKLVKNQYVFSITVLIYYIFNLYASYSLSLL